MAGSTGLNPYVSFVSITEDLKAQVAKKVGRPLPEVQSYLDTETQDNELLRAFLFFGVGPIRKRFV